MNYCVNIECYLIYVPILQYGAKIHNVSVILVKCNYFVITSERRNARCTRKTCECIRERVLFADFRKVVIVVIGRF